MASQTAILAERQRFDYSVLNVEITPTSTTISAPANTFSHAVRVELKESYVYGVSLSAGLPTSDYFKVNGLVGRVMATDGNAAGLLLPVTGERTVAIYNNFVLHNSRNGTNFASNDVRVTDQNGGTTNFTKIMLVFLVAYDRDRK